MFARRFGPLLRGRVLCSLLPSLRPAALSLHPSVLSTPWPAQALSRLSSHRAIVACQPGGRFPSFASSAAPPPNAEAAAEPPSGLDLEELDADGVVQFATEQGLDDKATEILEKEDIDGSHLLEVTKDKLVSLGLPDGSAYKLMRAVQAHKPARLLYGFCPLGGTFLNREQEVARLFALNASNNWNNGADQHHKYTIPVSSHLFGSGKTRLSISYVEQLPLKPFERRIRRELEQMSRKEGHGPAFVQYGLHQLAVMQGGAVRQLWVLAREDLEKTLAHLRFALLDLMRDDVQCPLAALVENGQPPSGMETCRRQCMYLMDELRKRGPVSVCIDEIGRLSDDDLQTLPDSLAELFFSRTAPVTSPDDQPHLHPLHVYLCGFTLNWPAVERKGGTKARREMLLLQPLDASHVKTIAKEDYEFSLPMEVCGEIERITGGVPRMIHYLIEVLQCQPEKQQGEWTMEALHHSFDMMMKTRRSRHVDFIPLDMERFAEFARFVVLEEWQIKVPVQGSATERYPFATQVNLLPTLALRDPKQRDVYTVRCCPMYLSHLRDYLEEVDYATILAGRGQRLTMDRSSRRQYDVLERLFCNLLGRLLVARKPEARQMRGTPVKTTLQQWLPSLFERDDRAKALQSVMKWTMGRDRTRRLPIYFDHFNLQGEKEGEEEECKRGEATDRTNAWSTIQQLLRQHEKPDSTGAIVMPGPESGLPDLMVRLPCSFSCRLLSFHVHSSMLDVTGIKAAVGRLPTDMPDGSHQLLVLCADAMTEELKGALGDERFLVLSKKAGEDEGQMQCAKAASKEVRQSLQEAANLLPPDAMAALMAPSHFADFALKPRGD